MLEMIRRHRTWHLDELRVAGKTVDLGLESLVFSS
jgi:hypothetical protein